MTLHLNTHTKVNVSVPLINKERQKNKFGNSRATPQSEKSSSSSRETKIECPQCSKAYPHNKSLQRHIRDQHTRKMEATISPGRHLKGACVDFEKGLFLISRTFSGIMYPIHCQHLTIAPHDSKKVSSSCELDECVDASRVTRRSDHPALECGQNVQSVQYANPFGKPVDLRDESLEEIVGGRFNRSSIKQKDICVTESGNKLVNLGVRLFDFRVTSMVHILEELCIFLFLKAQSLLVTFFRVEVSYDPKQGKWSCRCCRTKICCKSSCKIHKLTDSILFILQTQAYQPRLYNKYLCGILKGILQS